MILHSQIIGEGTPFIILHGFLGMSDNWKTLGRKFAERGYEMHLVDQRNHGRSFHDDAFSYEIMAEDLKTYCEHHEISEMVLLGHSMGGKTAMRFAASYPEMVTQLLVADIGPKKYPQHHQDILKALALLDFSKITSRNEADQVLEGYIMALFNDTPFLNEAGGIIVVEKRSQDYSFSEICQIVEASGGIVLGTFISKIENDVTQATVKIGHTGMNEIVQTFRRYSYNVVSEHAEDKLMEDLKDRSDYLDKYLNI